MNSVIIKHYYKSTVTDDIVSILLNIFKLSYIYYKNVCIKITKKINYVYD